MALLTMFRMLFRPLPQADPDTPIWGGLQPERINWKMVRLNALRDNSELSNVKCRDVR
jgi:hypothetical protein